MINNNEDYLPEMVEAPKQVEVSASTTGMISEEDRIKMSEKYDIEADEISDEIEIDEEDIPQVSKKQILNKKDIFISTPSSKKNIKIKNNDDDEIIEDINDNLDEDIPPKVKKVKNDKPKRVMSEEHKKKLAIARAKGLEARKNNALMRKKAREELQAEKELIKQVKHKRVQKLKKELEDDEPVEKKVEIIEKEKIIEKGYTEEQLQSAIAKALYVEEEKRQVRKAEKKKKKEEEEQQKKIFNTISKAVNPSPWDVCF